MFNMPGGPEVAVILLVALIVLGPDQLPKAMRTLGQAMAEIRKVSSGFQTEMRNAMDTIDTTAKDAVSTKPGSSKPTSSGDDVATSTASSNAGGHVEEVVARNDAPRSSDADARPGSDDKPSPAPGPSAADRAAG